MGATIRAGIEVYRFNIRSSQLLEDSRVHSKENEFSCRHRYDCVYFVPVDNDSTTAFTWNFLAPRSFDRSCVANFFRRRENFVVRAKIWEKKVWTDAINSVQKSWKSEPSSRFLSHLKIENSLATFGRIQPIVPGFIALYPP